MNVIPSEGVPSLPLDNSYGWTEPKYDLRYSQKEVVPFYPIAGISKNMTSVRFSLPRTSGTVMYDLSKITLVGRIALRDKAKAKVPAMDTMVAPINNILNSTIKTLNISFNNKTVCNLNHYHLLAYVKEKLTKNDWQLNTTALMGGYSPDTTALFDVIGNDNLGFESRRQMFGRSNADGKFVFEDTGTLFMTKLNHHLPLIQYLTNVDIIIDIILNDANTFLMAPDGADVNYEILEYYLLVEQLTLTDAYCLKNKKMLESKPLQHYFRKIDSSVFHIKQNAESEKIDTISLGQRPSRVLLLFSEQKRFDGHLTLNPFKFAKTFASPDDATKKFGLKSVKAQINNFNLNGYAVENDDKFRDQYLTLFRALQLEDNLINISYLDYVDNFCVVAIDLTLTGADCDNENLISLVRDGYLKVTIKLDKGATTNLYVFCISESESKLILTSEGKVEIDSI